VTSGLDLRNRYFTHSVSYVSLVRASLIYSTKCCSWKHLAYLQFVLCSHAKLNNTLKRTVSSLRARILRKKCMVLCNGPLFWTLISWWRYGDACCMDSPRNNSIKIQHSTNAVIAHLFPSGNILNSARSRIILCLFTINVGFIYNDSLTSSFFFV
jgi:hypothetical protein